MKKIAFFDIDGTLTSEIDGSIPESAVYAIRAARANGNLMFIQVQVFSLSIDFCTCHINNTFH